MDLDRLQRQREMDSEEDEVQLVCWMAVDFLM